MILITGGMGFIGSHTCVELLNNGEEVIIFDNLSNSDRSVLDKIEQITGKKVKFYECDVLNIEDLDRVFKENRIESVIHFAALKSVGESVEKPLQYYENNLCGTINLLKVMKKYNCNNFVFSSSATVYGDPKTVPITEDFPLSTTNPYGTTKLMMENILQDVAKSNQDNSFIILRYFNPIGAHESGLLGENPKGIPNNLMPYICRVATGEYEKLSIFGNDYLTKDGTGVRDYLHVVDLAKGHVKAINKVRKSKGTNIYNLGTGTGYSVLDLVETFEKVNEIKVNYQIVERRAGDIAKCYADPSKAFKELDWKAEKDLMQMCKDTWYFIQNNK